MQPMNAHFSPPPHPPLRTRLPGLIWVAYELPRCMRTHPGPPTRALARHHAHALEPVTVRPCRPAQEACLKNSPVWLQQLRRAENGTCLGWDTANMLQCAAHNNIPPRHPTPGPSRQHLLAMRFRQSNHYCVSHSPFVVSRRVSNVQPRATH